MFETEHNMCHIENYHVQEKITRIPAMDCYQVNFSDIKSKWLRKIVYWIKKKLEARDIIEPHFCRDTSFIVHSVNFDLDKIGKLINKELYEFSMRGEEVHKIMVGRELFLKISNSTELNRTGVFRVTLPPYTTNSRPQYYFQHIELIVNPYMDGIVFIPEHIL